MLEKMLMLEDIYDDAVRERKEDIELYGAKAACC